MAETISLEQKADTEIVIQPTDTANYYAMKFLADVSEDGITSISDVEYGTYDGSTFDKKGNASKEVDVAPCSTYENTVCLPDPKILNIFLKSKEVGEISIESFTATNWNPDVGEEVNFMVTVKNNTDTQQNVNVTLVEEICRGQTGCEITESITIDANSSGDAHFTNGYSWTEEGNYDVTAEVAGKSVTKTVSVGAAPTGICNWIDESGIGNLTKDHARYVFWLAQGATTTAQDYYDGLSPQPSEISANIATKDGARGVFWYAQGALITGNDYTGCNYSSLSSLYGAREMNLIESMLYDVERRTLAEPAQAIKEYLAKNYGDENNCLTSSGRDSYSDACITGNLATPLPEGHTQEDICAGSVADWYTNNMGWCMEEPAPENAPAVTTLTADQITETGARIRAEVTALNADSCQVWLVYGTTTSMNNSTSKVTLSSPDTAGTTLSGLSAGTTYYVQAKASNSYGTSSGSRKSFTTEEEPAPEEVPQAIKEYLAKNYGNENNCLTESGRDRYSDACITGNLKTPLPTGYTQEDICAGYVADWYTNNFGWCMEEEEEEEWNLRVKAVDKNGNTIHAHILIGEAEGEESYTGKVTPQTFDKEVGSYWVKVTSPVYKVEEGKPESKDVYVTKGTKSVVTFYMVEKPPEEKGIEIEVEETTKARMNINIEPPYTQIPPVIARGAPVYMRVYASNIGGQSLWPGLIMKFVYTGDETETYKFPCHTDSAGQELPAGEGKSFNWKGKAMVKIPPDASLGTYTLIIMAVREATKWPP